MKAIFENLLKNIPDYQVFLTPDELDQNSRNLAADFPEVVSLMTIGQTKEGKDLLCLKIGQGSKNALMFGCPHPNEPIGTMMLEYFTKALASQPELRAEFDYTWYVVKAWDRDGLDRNSGWLKGPFTTYNYSKNFFRPAGHQQVEWTFPIHYKDLNFDKTLPETRAMMQLIDEIQPEFIYSLHNAGFGGAYWYLTHQLPEARYTELRQAADRVKVPLHLGEPEMPYLVPLSPAIYPNLSISKDYDYLEKYGTKDIGQKILVGDSSAAYASKYGSFTLLAELPYFYDPRIMDQSPTDMTRRDAILYQLDQSEKSNAYIRSILEATAGLCREDSQFRMALVAFSKDDYNESTRKMVEEEEYQRPATEAELLDSVHLSPFYKSLSYGMATRMCQEALEEWQAKAADLEAEDTGAQIENVKAETTQAETARAKAAPDESTKTETTPAKTDRAEIEAAIAKLTDLVASCAAAHADLDKENADALHYSVVPIHDLVSIQLESGLIVLEALKNGEIKPLAD